MAPADPRGWRLGGAVAYAGLTLARLGLRPWVLMGMDPLTAEAAELDLLRDAGAEVFVVPMARSPVFDNREVDGVRAQRCVEPGERLSISALPAKWGTATTWVLGPVATELDADWASVPAAGAFVALGWQGLLRDLSRDAPVRRAPPRPSPLVARANLVVASRLDLEPGTAIAGLGSILRPGSTLVVTDGEAGGTTYRIADDRAAPARRYPAIAAARVVDPTGAGDAFMAGLVAARVGHPLAGSGRRGTGLRLAAALGSLTVEAAGLWGVPSLEAVAERLRASLSRG